VGDDLKVPTQSVTYFMDDHIEYCSLNIMLSWRTFVGTVAIVSHMLSHIWTVVYIFSK